jgi:hypothetical protein
VIGLYKIECMHRGGSFRAAEELELATCNWVHWLGTTRLHGAVGSVPSVEYGADYHRHLDPAGNRSRDKPSLHKARDDSHRRLT